MRGLPALTMAGTPSLNEWPSDPRDQECGRFGRADFLDGMKSCRKLICASGIPEEEVDDWLDRLAQNVRDTSHHWYMPW
jgi:hypothetical protein